ncbi:hypothetical protein [Acanthopleuribacter pedis]|uniref:Uncharacterized protein n=1 Tax=Acanthopleuribacter pedis TaxID=442870 RepID=A0A8J7U729_9BACT|nr:hypothetical protein [Acanthopleuribacter pedis]MBO1323387.1 hypothetical protein [Acanthopleuribacter pedis]
MFTLLIVSLLMQASPAGPVPHHLYPDERVMDRTLYHLRTSRTMMSDYPELYRQRWSSAMEGPCPEVLVGPEPNADNPLEVPCTVIPYAPNPIQPIPLALVMGYQHVVYTPPRSPTSTKASMSLSWEYTLISAGINWKITINSEGVKHDIWYCDYRTFPVEIEILPLVTVTVDMLQPYQYYHIAVQPTGNYTIQTHRIRAWETPISAMNLGLIYDVWPNRTKCGTETYIYTTKPAEELMEVLGSIAGDAAELVDGDQHIIITPMLGFKHCGEFSYPLFHRIMNHRPAPTPALYGEGPPLEIWSIQGARDHSESTAQVLDPNATITHGRVAGVREELQASGLQGPILTDPNMVEAVEAQRNREDRRFKSGRDLTDAALSLIQMLRDNPDNDHLWELFERFVGPNIDHIERMNDTQIEFNPFGRHCTDQGYLGHIPVLGAHFFEQLGEHCTFCQYHDRIVIEPRRGWSHSRLNYVDWVWSALHGPRGNLREKAHRFIRTLILPDPSEPPRETLTDLQNRLGRRQVNQAQQGQTPPPTLSDLEATPSDTTENSTQSETADSLPGIFLQPFVRCTDPTWTIEYLTLYGEIEDVLQAPCGLLWGVAG